MLTIAPGDLWGNNEDAAAINFYHDQLPGQTFYMWVFENVAAQEDMWSAYEPPLDWQFEGETIASYQTMREGQSGLELEWNFRAEGQEDSLDLEVTFTNRSDRTLHDICCDTCLQFRGAPDFRDTVGERCIVWVEGQPVPAISTRRTIWTGSWSPHVQAYRIEGHEVPYPRGVVPGLRKWSASPQPVSVGLIAMASHNESWHIGIAWERSWSLGHNPSPPHHCIHGDPGIGTLEPAQRATVLGRIYFVEGDAAGLLSRYEADF